MAKGFKTGGRKIGTPNRTTVIVRDVLFIAMLDEIKNLRSYVAEIEKPEVKIKVLGIMMPYLLPKMAAQDFNEAGGLTEQPKKEVTMILS